LIDFHPEPSLVPGTASPACRASVIIPARNEEDSLAATLDALAAQVDLTGAALPPDSFEVILLLNNCTDRSAQAARFWLQQHPGFCLQIAERILAPDVAHVGFARRCLMDTAWHRLHSIPGTAILSTDADTRVAPDWVAQNLAALALGADAVGGVIRLLPGHLESLSPATRLCYQRDRIYQAFLAELEDFLDPQPGDPAPRHLEHFGASLACTPEVYAHVGGLPPVKPLEDVAFVDQLRRADARLRHAPEVIVYTSSRLDGRAEIGLSHQLRVWQGIEEHRVPSAAWLVHRFRTIRSLRLLFQQLDPGLLAPFSPPWQHAIQDAGTRSSGIGDFLGKVDCNRLVQETFTGAVEGPIDQVNHDLANIITALRLAPYLDSDDIAPDALWA
jgi:hypothetical protein